MEEIVAKFLNTQNYRTETVECSSKCRAAVEVLLDLNVG